MQHIDIEKMAQGYPPSVIGKDCEEVTIALAKRVLSLQQKLDEVLAEVVAIREQAENVYASGYNQGHLNTVDGCAYAVTVEDEFYHNALQVMLEVETPATDALLNSVRAEGVEMYANLLKKRYDGIEYEIIGNCETNGEEMRISDTGEVESALSFAAQLRAETDTTSSQYESLAGGK